MGTGRRREDALASTRLFKREWVQVSRYPSVVIHTWEQIDDAVVTALNRGELISYLPEKCISIFYGKPMTCPCGLIDVSALYG